MSRDRLRQAQAALAAAIEQRSEAHRTAVHAVAVVRDHETEAAEMVTIDQQIADHHKEQMKGRIRSGNPISSLPLELMEAKRCADEAAVSLTGARAARDDLLWEREEAVRSEQAAQVALVSAAGAVMAEEGEAMARELLAAKARVGELDESLHALAAIWLPRLDATLVTTSMAPIPLPAVVGQALRAPAGQDWFNRPAGAVNRFADEWKTYLSALQVNPEAVRIEGDNP